MQLVNARSATLIGTPIGILAGTYLAEFGQRGWLAPITRFINDILLSARHRSSLACLFARYMSCIAVIFRLGRRIVDYIQCARIEHSGACVVPAKIFITLSTAC